MQKSKKNDENKKEKEKILKKKIDKIKDKFSKLTGLNAEEEKNFIVNLTKYFKVKKINSPVLIFKKIKRSFKDIKKLSKEQAGDIDNMIKLVNKEGKKEKKIVVNLMEESTTLAQALQVGNEMDLGVKVLKLVMKYCLEFYNEVKTSLSKAKKELGKGLVRFQSQPVLSEEGLKTIKELAEVTLKALETYKKNLDTLNGETTNPEIVDFDKATSWWNPFKAFYRKRIAQKMCKKLANGTQMDALVNKLKPNDEILDGIEKIANIEDINGLRKIKTPKNCPERWESPVTLFGILAGTAIGTELFGILLPK